MNIRRKLYRVINLDLSLKRTRSYSYCVQDRCLQLDYNPTLLIDAVKGIHTIGRRTLQIGSWSLYEIVWDAIVLEFKIMGDNARSHRDHIVDVIVKKRLFAVWVNSRSLALIANENFCYGLGRATTKRNRPSRIGQELKAAIFIYGLWCHKLLLKSL